MTTNTCFDCNKNAPKERRRPEINSIYHQINLFVFVKCVFIQSNGRRLKNDKTQVFLWPVQTTGTRNKGACVDFSTKVSGRIGYVSCNSTSCFESIGKFFSRRIWQKEGYNMASADSLLRS